MMMLAFWGTVRIVFFDPCFAQAAIDGFSAAPVLHGKLCCGLFACTVGCPEFVIIKTLDTIKRFATTVAFVSLFAVLPAVLFDPP